MKHKYNSPRCVTAFFGLLFAVCVAFGLYRAVNFAYAEVSLTEGFTVTLAGSEFEYTGNAIQPEVTVTAAGGEALTVGEDYIVTYLNNVEAGVAIVRVEGTGEYEGAITENFSITKVTDNAWNSRNINVPGWNYGSYSPLAHVFTVNAKYGSDNAVFTFYNGNEVINDLSTLGAGTYRVTARIDESNSYNGLDEDLEDIFTVGMADNDWNQYPKVVEWEYDNYDKNVNLVLGAATYGNVTFTLRDGDEILARNFSAPDGVVSPNVEGILKGLEVGTYVLEASVDGGDNYKDIVGVRTEFEVKPTSNDWVVYPDVVQWQYDGYNVNTNLFLASVNYGNVSFVVKTAEDGEDITPVFTVDEGGIINDDEEGTIAKILGGLEKGVYYLSASVEVDNENREQVQSRGKAFEVLQAANGWMASPNVISWAYGSYNPEINIIIGAPMYGTAKFSITDADGERSLTGEFTVTDGKINDDGTVASVLSRLGRGNYLLTATVDTDRNGNYAPISNTAPLQFSISRAVNGWTETPSIESWIKGKYDGEVNFVSVSAVYGAVDYVIYETTDEENIIYQVTDGEVVIDKLADANVGYYTLRANVAETNDYSGIEKTFTFNIFAPAGLPWWAIALIVVGSLGVVALVFFILHIKGVLQMLTGKFLVALRTKMTVDATIAAVRANKVAAAAKISVAAAEAEEAERARNADNGSDDI